MNLIKKTNTTKLSMNDKVKKAFKTYCKVIIFGTCFAVSTTTAFAANDPITVVNNLSDFIFPSQRANGFLTLAGGIIITFAKEILTLITG